MRTDAAYLYIAGFMKDCRGDARDQGATPEAEMRQGGKAGGEWRAGNTGR